jgi:hypothetical protein
MREMSLAGFIGHLGALPAELHHATHKALERAAVLVEKEAKAEIGHYQGAAGPFAAWAPLAERTIEDRVAKGFTPDDPLLRTGTLRDSIHHKVEMTGPASGVAVIGSASDIAVWQELGTAKIPPRSFLGGAAVREGHAIAEICGKGVAVAIVGGAGARSLTGPYGE